jgi:molecular chaperone GrpE (heat shock protein)
MRKYLSRKPQQSSTQSIPSFAGSLVLVNTGLRDLWVLLRDIHTQLAEFDRQTKAVQLHASNAWHEHSQIVTDYFELSRGLLRILDNFDQILRTNAEVSPVAYEIKTLLEKQCIGTILVKEGDPFNAELCLCEEILEKEGFPSNAVVEVLEPGFEKTLGDGSRIVIRPVKVIISK